jgi:pyruvate dehydrogenase E2 component (dihydrolipoamide acetyltransferase)
MSIFKLPDLGEGLQDAEIVEWHVKEGDVVKLDQVLVSMETAKAIVEVPAPMAGTITKLHGKAGDTILTGAPLVEFTTETSKAGAPIAPTTSTESADSYRKDTGTVAGKLEESDQLVEEECSTITRAGVAGGIKVTPAVRALAQKLKVDLSLVTPTGPNNTIIAKDVQQAASGGASTVSAGSAVTANNRVVAAAGGALADATPLKGVRKAMAQAMIASHSVVVPVTICEDAVLLNWHADFDITVRLIAAIAVGIKHEPAINCWFDGKALARKLMPTIELGLAMDTNDGLFVPVIHDVGNKTKEELRAEIDSLKLAVKTRTIAPEKLRGATITLSNFGKFAGKYANPVVVPPTVAILGVGAIRDAAVVVNNKVTIAKVLPLALTFDHRALTGGEATRFLGHVIAELGD